MAESTRRKLSVKVKSEVIDFEDADGVVKTYTIKELVGDARRDLQSVFEDNITVDENGKPVKVKDLEAMARKLLSICLYDESGKLVTEEAMKLWPIRGLLELCNVAAEVSGLGDAANKALENAKNG